MSPPERTQALPVCAEERWPLNSNSSNLGSTVEIPKVARVDMGDISDGRSIGLFQYLPELGAGRTSLPEYVIHTVKGGVFGL